MAIKYRSIYFRKPKRFSEERYEKALKEKRLKRPPKEIEDD